MDVLFLENLVMNYLILTVTAKFSKRKVSNLRLFSGALVGAAFVVALVAFPEMKAWYTTPSKIAISLVIVAVAFSPSKVGAFLKTLAIFYVSTFIFAGAAFAFLYFNGRGGFLKNGIVYVYWHSKMSFLIPAAITAGIIIKIFWDAIKSRFVKEQFLITLRIFFEKKAVAVPALVDTGNSLHDPITSMPVVIVEFSAIKDILPEEIRRIFNESKDGDLNTITSIISASSWFSRFRLIPFSTLGTENGMLLGFRPDYIEVGESRTDSGIRDVIVGVYNRTLSHNHAYSALLNPELVA